MRTKKRQTKRSVANLFIGSRTAVRSEVLNLLKQVGASHAHSVAIILPAPKRRLRAAMQRVKNQLPLKNVLEQNMSLALTNIAGWFLAFTIPQPNRFINGINASFRNLCKYSASPPLNLPLKAPVSSANFPEIPYSFLPHGHQLQKASFPDHPTTAFAHKRIY